MLVEGEDVRDEGRAAPPPQLEVVVLNPEQSMQELTHILVDALQRYEQSCAHNSVLSSVWLCIRPINNCWIATIGICMVE